MWDAVFWLYLADVTLLLVHEIDSAYWKEWDLFGLPGGAGAFVVIHVPLVAGALYGQALVLERARGGLVVALGLAAAGAAAFVIHTYFLTKGRPEFRSVVSIGILAASLLVSLALATVAAVLLAGA